MATDEVLAMDNRRNFQIVGGRPRTRSVGGPDAGPEVERPLIQVAHAHRRATDRQWPPDVLRLAQIDTVPTVAGENVGRGLAAGHGDDIRGPGLVGRAVPDVLQGGTGAGDRGCGRILSLVRIPPRGPERDEVVGTVDLRDRGGLAPLAGENVGAVRTRLHAEIVIAERSLSRGLW